MQAFVLPQQGIRVVLDLYQFRGCKGLQPSKVNVVFQGGMASAFAKASADTSVPSHFLFVIRAN